MRKTTAQTLSFLGAVFSEGQPNNGVRYGPKLIRESGIFDILKENYNVTKIQDYGDISIKNLTTSEQQIRPVQHEVNNLHKIGPILKHLNSKAKEIINKQ